MAVQGEVRPVRPRPVVLFAVMVAVAVVVLGVPFLLSRTLPRHLDTAMATTREQLPSSTSSPMARFAPPPGWTLKSLGGTASSPVEYTSGTATLSAWAVEGGFDVDLLARRQLRLMAGRVTGTGRTSTDGGFTGPVYSLSGPVPGTLAVVGQGPVAVVVRVVGVPDGPFDAAAVIRSVTR